MGRTGVAIGLNKGFITTEIAKKKVRARPSLRKGILGKRTKTIRYIKIYKIYL
jgi:large subunit ribosomal protein L36e